MFWKTWIIILHVKYFLWVVTDTWMEKLKEQFHVQLKKSIFLTMIVYYFKLSSKKKECIFIPLIFSAARATSHAGNASSPRLAELCSFIFSPRIVQIDIFFLLSFLFFLFFVFLFSTCNTTRTHCLELHFCWALLFRFWAQTYFRIGLEGFWLWQWFTLTEFSSCSCLH